ncbi:HesA/MoeB/ThiF family protein [Clostridium grantii]|uniref:Molybdopterin or thiamine biosynthesis adenylyltransferase n=1 Tax=Clostridium grantii DSM 8605 TaxID=1121316 RepID=A0A1M5RPC8_9CLOT|nr:HesA/MoeB/ThiF family protein [Clostridium grantii]SHH28155.1 Molybdopterin or thiamine biosynthesis adenylyltransferase [Clostridium grantii DSM 8605]
MERYSRNLNSISLNDNKILKKSKVCVVGCGGLGGYIVEHLARIGVGNITVVDGDIFQCSNLNRQLFSDEKSLGKNKVLKAKERITLVNSDVKLTPIAQMLNKENGLSIIKDHHVVIDALDNISTRLLLEGLCELQGIPLVHGSVAGWYGQVTTIFPGEKTLSKIYKKEVDKGVEKQLGNLSFVVANIASIQSSEVIKILLSKENPLRNKILVVDMIAMDYEIMEIK